METEAERFIVKLAGSGEGYASLVAEIIVGHLAASIGLQVPERVIVSIDRKLPSENQDPELLQLLAASEGPNVGDATIDGARDFEPADAGWVSEDEAARIVWLDWWVMNPDRTPQNPNLLIRRGKLWLIDHGSALGFHHDWSAVREDTAHRRWGWRKGHVLIDRATVSWIGM